MICLFQMACGGDIISIDPLDNMSDWKCVRCNSLISYDSVQNLNTNLAVQVDDVMKVPNFQYHKNYFTSR